MTLFSLRNLKDTFFGPAKKGLWGALALLFCLTGLVGCGKMPSRLDPPPDAGNVVYPRSYPDLKTDPAP